MSLAGCISKANSSKPNTFTAEEGLRLKQAARKLEKAGTAKDVAEKMAVDAELKTLYAEQKELSDTIYDTPHGVQLRIAQALENKHSSIKNNEAATVESSSESVQTLVDNQNDVSKKQNKLTPAEEKRYQELVDFDDAGVISKSGKDQYGDPSDTVVAAWKEYKSLEKRRNADTSPERVKKSGESGQGESAAIEDFGEKISGARKEYAASYKDKMEAAKEMDVLAQPLSKSWPEPDYQKLIEAGASKRVVGLVRSMRDEIPNKPGKSYRQSTWAKQVELLRDTADRMLNDKEFAEKYQAEFKKTEHLKLDDAINGRAELYELLGHEKSLKGIRISRSMYGVYNGAPYNPHKIIWEVTKDAKATAFGNMPKTLGSGDTRQAAIDSFTKAYSALDTNKEKDNKTKFELYADRYAKAGDKGQFFIGKKVGRNVIHIKDGFDTVKEARSYITNNNDELAAILEQKKAIPNERYDINQPRVGQDMRNAQDVTPEMFSEAFGFRGVQFGNYVEGARRQQDLNNAYDALMDLAAVLDIPPKAISLNGELGLAFGARGIGGKHPASAHYESGHIVINLTKGSGAGSLAHEWWHSLDNYFSRQAGKKEDYATDRSDVALAARNADYFKKDDGIRKEMIDAFGSVVGAIKSTAIKQRSGSLDNRRTKEYWGTGIEMSARSFERYVIAKLHDNGFANDYLANVVSEEYWNAAEALGIGEGGSYPYPTESELPAIRDGFDKFFQVIESKETDKGVALFSQSTTPANNPYTLSTLATAIDKAMGRGFTKLLEATGMFKLIESSQIGKFLGEGVRFSVSSRKVAPSDYPATLAKSIFHTNTLRQHPDFKAAKEGGDVLAAKRIVDDVFKPSVASEIKALFDTGKPIYIIPVAQREGTGMNMIPAAYAHRLAAEIGGVVWTKTVKVSGKHNTDATANERTRNVQEFGGGTPPPGSQVLILDDTFTSGDTFTALVDRLANNGITPIAATTLANGRYQSELTPTEEQRGKLLAKAGLTEVQFQHEFSYPTSHLTGSEIRQYLFNGKAGRTGIIDRFPAKRIGTSTENSGSTPEVKYSADGSRILAFVKDGVTHLVYDNISSTDDNVKGLLLHEVGLHALTLGRTEPEFQAILKQFKMMGKMGNAQVRTAKEQAAAEKVDKAEGRVPKDTEKHLLDEEHLGHYLEQNPNSSFTQKVISWFRAQVRKLGAMLKGSEKFQFFQWANKLTPEDIVAMATTALKNAPTTLQNARSRGVFKADTQQQFYSQLRKVMRDAPDKIFGSGKQVALWLQANAGKNAIKSDEIFWSGITDWLDTQGKVSKADVLAFLDNSGVKVEVTMLGESLGLSPAQELEFNELLALGRSATPKQNERIAELIAISDKNEGTTPTTKHGGGNLVLPDGENYREIVLTAPQADKWGESDTTHFGDTGEGKAIAWLRVNDRTTATGEEALFIEEEQSKRGQAGRSEGFALELDKNINQDDLIATFINKSKDKYKYDWSAEVRTPKGIKIGDFWGGDEKLPDENRAKGNAYKYYLRGDVDSVPPAPFVSDGNNKATNAHITLAMKHAILDAIQRGKTVVAWTTGQQQKDRYALSKQIDGLSVQKDPYDPVFYIVQTTGKDGKIENHGQHKESELQNIIGKELAKKAIDDINAGRDAAYKGLDLDVGGEWADAMYGDENGLNASGKPSLMTQAVNEIFKQLKIEGKVESVEINHGRMWQPEIEQEIDDTTLQPGFTLTPALAAKVTNEGMTLFSKAEPDPIADLNPIAEKKAIDEAIERDKKGSTNTPKEKKPASAKEETPTNTFEAPGRALGLLIKVFTRNDLVGMYKNTVIGQHLKDYKELREQIAADTNQLFEVADNFLGDLRSLPKDLRTTFADLAHQSTLYAVDPAKATYVPGADAKELAAYLATNPSNKKLVDRIKARLASMEDAHKRLRAMYVGLPDTKFKNGKTARDLFDGLRQRYITQTTLMFEAFEGRINRLEVDADVKAKAIEELRGQLKTLLDRVYFPLFRAGDFTLNANKPGHQEIIEHHKTERQQRKQAKLLRADGYTVVESKRVVDSKDQKTVIATGAIKKLIESATANGTLAGDQLKALMDEIDQTIIKSMPDAAYRRSFIHRKGTAGYSNDFINAYANSMRRSSAHIANLRHADKIPALIEDMKKDIKSASKNTDSNTNALNDVVSRVIQIEKDLQIPSNKFSILAGRIGFAQMLGSVFNFMLNSTQVASYTFPHLQAEYGATKATLQLLKAYSDQTRALKLPKSLNEMGRAIDMRTRLKGDELDVFQRMHDSGKLDLSQTYDLIEAASTASDQVSDVQANIMKVIGLPQHLSEVMNRQVSAIAAIRLEMARSGNTDKAYQAARKAVDDTHGDYAKENAADIMSGNTMRPLMMFKKYGQFVMFTWGNTARLALEGSKTRDSDGNILDGTRPSERKKARKQLAGLLGVQLLASGVLGLPIYTTSAIVGSGMVGFKLGGERGAFIGIAAVMIAALASAFGDDDGEDFALELRRWLAARLGDNWAEIVSRGITPRSLGSRMDASQPFIRAPEKSHNKTKYLLEWIEALLGPFWGGTTAGAGAGYIDMTEGDPAGAKKFIPVKQLKDMATAWQWARDGWAIKDKHGAISTEVSTADAVWKSIGLNPSVAVKAKEREHAMYMLHTALEYKMKKIVERAVADKNPATRFNEMNAWNSKYAAMGYAINSGSISGAFTQDILTRGKPVEVGNPAQRPYLKKETEPLAVRR